MHYYRPQSEKVKEQLNSIFFDQNGNIRPVDSKLILEINPIERRLWARDNGIYQFITTEMVEWVRDAIGERTAIEICAGKGVLGRALHIPSTDGRILDRPEFAQRIKEMGERSTNPPADVFHFEAMDAVRHFMPQVVVGAFVSQIYRFGEDYNVIMSSPVGVDEELLIKKVGTYICFGNKQPHFGKRIFKAKHREYAFPWLVNRCEDQTKNRIWVWNK